MTTPERQRYDSIEFNKTLALIKDGMENNIINNFIIRGPVKDVPMKFFDFAFLFYAIPGNLEEKEIRTYTTNGSGAIEIYNQILKLNCDNAKTLKMPTIDSIKQASGVLASATHTPYITIALGEVVATKEKVAILLPIIGISPEDALNEIQAKIRERKDKFN